LKVLEPQLGKTPAREDVPKGIALLQGEAGEVPGVVVAMGDPEAPASRIPGRLETEAQGGLGGRPGQIAISPLLRAIPHLQKEDGGAELRGIVVGDLVTIRTVQLPLADHIAQVEQSVIHQPGRGQGHSPGRAVVAIGWLRTVASGVNGEPAGALAAPVAIEKEVGPGLEEPIEVLGVTNIRAGPAAAVPAKEDDTGRSGVPHQAMDLEPREPIRGRAGNRLMMDQLQEGFAHEVTRGSLPLGHHNKIAMQAFQAHGFQPSGKNVSSKVNSDKEEVKEN